MYIRVKGKKKKYQMALHNGFHGRNFNFYCILLFMETIRENKFQKHILVLNQNFQRLNNNHQISKDISQWLLSHPSHSLLCLEESAKTYLYVLWVNLISKESIKYHPHSTSQTLVRVISRREWRKTLNKISQNKKGELWIIDFKLRIPEGSDKLLPITLAGIEYNLCSVLKRFANL